MVDDIRVVASSRTSLVPPRDASGNAVLDAAARGGDCGADLCEADYPSYDFQI